MTKKQSIQIITLGCSKNQVDSEHILAQLDGEYEIVPEEVTDRRVDWLLVNTCGFIGEAKEQSIAEIMSCVDRKNRGLAG